MFRIALLLALFAVPASAAIDFLKQVQPILEKHCIRCHREGYKKSDYHLHTREDALAEEMLIPGKPEKSVFIELLYLDLDDGDLMPPSKEPQMTGEEKQILTDWVAEGAFWPAGAVVEMPTAIHFKRDILPILEKLTPDEQAKIKLWIKSGADWPAGSSAELELVKRIHAKIAETSKDKDAAEMKAYQGEIPVTKVKFEMVPVPAGEFTMGSPDSEPGHKAGESPQRKVKIKPFWIGKHEITWDEYEPFMIDGGRRNKDGSKKFPSEDDTDVDLVSRPTKPYVEMTFGMGKEGFPAISMTQHAALMYCKWLSAQTGHFYRLPTEAEWEYACRAGTDTAYSFGDKEADLHQYGWFIDNANFTYQKVGTKKPNPWGIHDMHGNVSEWTLDSYSKDGYEPKTTDNPWARSRDLYPRVVRGGSWNDFPDGLRSASRQYSAPEWKLQDPQLPKSPFYHTEPQWLGFRIIRPLEVPSAEEMHAIWNTGIDHDTFE